MTSQLELTLAKNWSSILSKAVFTTGSISIKTLSFSIITGTANNSLSVREILLGMLIVPGTIILAGTVTLSDTDILSDTEMLSGTEILSGTKILALLSCLSGWKLPYYF